MRLFPELSPALAFGGGRGAFAALHFALLGGSFPVVRAPLPFVCGALPFVRQALPFVR